MRKIKLLFLIVILSGSVNNSFAADYRSDSIKITFKPDTNYYEMFKRVNSKDLFETKLQLYPKAYDKVSLNKYNKTEWCSCEIGLAIIAIPLVGLSFIGSSVDYFNEGNKEKGYRDLAIAGVILVSYALLIKMLLEE